MSGAGRAFLAILQLSYRSLGLVAVAMTGCIAVQRFASAQPPDATAEAEVLRLPTALPDGRPLRAIGFYQSQVAELVPKDYEPVRIDEFSTAVRRLADRATDDQTSRVKGSVYWINVNGDTLVSDLSVLDIESYRRGLLRRSLLWSNGSKPGSATAAASGSVCRVQFRHTAAW